MRPSIEIFGRLKAGFIKLCRFAIFFSSFYGICTAQSDVRRLMRFQYNNLIAFSPKWTLQSDLGMRLNGAFESKSQAFIQSTMGYRLADKVLLHTGMSFIGNYASNEVRKLEYRPYEQLTVLDQIKKMLTSHRLRVEQRYAHALAYDGHPAVNTLVCRWRYRFQVSVPLLTYRKESVIKQLILNFGDEVFYNTGRKYLNHAFDRNRVYSDLILQFSNRFSIGMSYDYVFRRVPNTEDHFGRDYVFNVGLRHNILLME